MRRLNSLHVRGNSHISRLDSRLGLICVHCVGALDVLFFVSSRLVFGPLAIISVSEPVGGTRQSHPALMPSPTHRAFKPSPRLGISKTAFTPVISLTQINLIYNEDRSKSPVCGDVLRNTTKRKGSMFLIPLPTVLEALALTGDTLAAL